MSFRESCMICICFVDGSNHIVNIAAIQPDTMYMSCQDDVTGQGCICSDRDIKRIAGLSEVTGCIVDIAFIVAIFEGCCTVASGRGLLKVSNGAGIGGIFHLGVLIDAAFFIIGLVRIHFGVSGSYVGNGWVGCCTREARFFVQVAGETARNRGDGGIIAVHHLDENTAVRMELSAGEQPVYICLFVKSNCFRCIHDGSVQNRNGTIDLCQETEHGVDGGRLVFLCGIGVDDLIRSGSKCFIGLACLQAFVGDIAAEHDRCIGRTVDVDAVEMLICAADQECRIA